MVNFLYNLFKIFQCFACTIFFFELFFNKKEKKIEIWNMMKRTYSILFSRVSFKIIYGSFVKNVLYFKMN